jgi:nucleoside-diphosphate-sugar epimerase
VTSALGGIAHLDHPLGLAADLERALDRCAADLRGLGGATVVLTGGTGFVGTWLLEVATWARSRLGTGPRIVVLTRDPRRFASLRPHLAGHEWVHVVAGDVRHVDPAVLAGDVVIAAAAPSAAAGDVVGEEDLRATTTAGAVLVRSLLERGASRALYLSSGAAGHEHRDTYGSAKRWAEQLLVGNRGPGRTVVARLFAFVGPYLPLDEGFAVGNFIGDVLAARPIRVRGDGTAVRSYLYAPDLAWWLWALATRGGPGDIVDVGSPQALTITELAAAVARLVDPPLPVVVEGVAVPSSAPDIYVPDVAAAASLGLYVSVGLETALRRTFDWHRSKAGGGSS